MWECMHDLVKGPDSDADCFLARLWGCNRRGAATELAALRIDGVVP